MTKTLTSYERETIINFNEGENTASIFTYSKTWQRHLEGKLGLQPVMVNGFGAKEYELDKKLIRPPRAKRQLSESAKQRLRAMAATRNRYVSAKNNTRMAKSARKSGGE